MSVQGKKVITKVFCLAAVVLAGFCLYLSIVSRYKRYLVWGMDGYCKAILANGYTFPVAKPDDYSTQFQYCKHSSASNWEIYDYNQKKIRVD